MALYIFSNRLYSEPFSFNVGVPKYYLDFFDSRKIRISLFYMKEHIELEYIIRNRVERALHIFSDRLYSEQYCFKHWGA